jgi:hypothetical protein
MIEIQDPVSAPDAPVSGNESILGSVACDKRPECWGQQKVTPLRQICGAPGKARGQQGFHDKLCCDNVGPI